MRSARRTKSDALLASVLVVGLVLAFAAESRAAQALEGKGGSPKIRPGAARLSGFQVRPGRLTGTVTDADRVTPLAGVPVMLMDVGAVRVVSRGATGTHGGYVLEGVPSGTWRLRIGKPGIITPLKVTRGADAVSVNAIIPKLLVRPSAAAAPKGMAGRPIPATATVNPGGVMLMPMFGGPPGGPPGGPSTPPAYSGPRSGGPPSGMSGGPPRALFSLPPGGPPGGGPPWTPPWVSPIRP